MSQLQTLRLVKELREAHDHSIYLQYNDDNVREVTALLIGPAQTPYAFGLFYFALSFPEEYPLKPPRVIALTTNRGRTRFNPNIYADGKVCLSILGTWQGQPWSSALGVTSCLTSILSLLSEHPYTNEPGFERLDEEKSALYNQKIQHETIRISVLDRMEDNPSELDKRLFLMYYEQYLSVCEKSFGGRFQRTAFEHEGNAMDGNFDWKKLTSRLHRVYQSIEFAPPVVHRLTRQFEQCYEYFKDELVELSTDDFVTWNVNVFGRPMSRLEGGIVRVKMTESRYIIPDLFHPNISHGTPYIEHHSSMQERVSELIDFLHREPDSHPAARINIAASSLYWGSLADQKLFRRKFRECVENSVV